MKIGMITDSLGHLAFDEFLPTAAEVGIEVLEFACGNWSSAPHLDLDDMLESKKSRSEFRAKVADHGLQICALNCSGNHHSMAVADRSARPVWRSPRSQSPGKGPLSVRPV